MNKKNSEKQAPSSNQNQPESRVYDFLFQGTNALHNGEIAKATRFLEQAHGLDSANIDAALNLAGAYILSKRFAKALAILEPLSEHDSDNPMVWTNLGAAYLGNPILAKDAHHRRAIAAFERALEIDPTTPNVAYNLGLIYLDRQEHDQALHWFNRAVRANPKDRDAWNHIKRLSSHGSGNDL